MNRVPDESNDELERALNALRAQQPPPARASLRDDVVTRFPARRVAPHIDVRRAAGFVLSAAAVATFALLLARRELEPTVPPTDVAVSSPARALMLELDELARRIERLPPPRVPDPPTYDEPSDDPEFARLVVARGYEGLDVERARERYRVLSETSQDGPVRDVALARLEALGR